MFDRERRHLDWQRARSPRQHPRYAHFSLPRHFSLPHYAHFSLPRHAHFSLPHYAHFSLPRHAHFSLLRIWLWLFSRHHAYAAKWVR
jgi:hypothetical protein